MWGDNKVNGEEDKIAQNSPYTGDLTVVKISD